MHCAVAHGVNIRVDRLAVVIDDDAIVDFEPRVGRELGIRQDPNADDDEVRGYVFTVEVLLD